MINDENEIKPPYFLRSAFCIFISAFVMAIFFAGCAGGGQPDQPDGPQSSAETRTEPWSYNGDPGVLIHTAHYDIHTTIADPNIQTRFADVMEGAFGEYQRVAPGVSLSNKPMDCYMFKNRGEWEDYTRRQLGVVGAMIYLKISRGGYCFRDWYAGYDLSSTAATLSVAAHEGWHQFAARNFKGRLPPFLEEGIATMFEDLSWEDNLPRWKLSQNRSRLQSLRGAVEGNFVYPLSELSQMHAGNVVAESGNRTEAFYGESWGFATFLWCGDDGKYRPILRHMLSDVADGTVFDPSGVLKDKLASWNPSGVKPMLEHYLGMSMEQINAEYQKYIRSVAFDHYAAQWN